MTACTAWWSLQVRRGGRGFVCRRALFVVRAWLAECTEIFVSGRDVCGGGECALFAGD